MLGTVLLVILILLLIGAFPRWGYSTGWGYYPSGGVSPAPPEPNSGVNGFTCIANSRMGHK